jgi:hypothetical protein
MTDMDGEGGQPPSPPIEIDQHGTQPLADANRVSSLLAKASDALRRSRALLSLPIYPDDPVPQNDQPLPYTNG